MAIKMKEAAVPKSLPPAKLFLEDIEEIVRIFRDAAQDIEDKRPDKDAKIEIEFEIGEKVCDDVQELPKIAKRTHDLSIEVRKGFSYRTSLYLT